jgi:phage shock protein PspC (stress-responsive transcriptional regulator)
VDRQVAGVCGGIARYLSVDPVLIRIAWIVLTIVPGAIFLGALAYLVAWLIIPETEPGLEQDAAGSGEGWASKRLHRSASDSKLGGVCGGIAEYFEVDPTAVRLLWVVLSIFPGAVVCGVLTYLVAWFIVPLGASVVPPAQPEPA